jgi:hypothetical protein
MNKAFDKGRTDLRAAPRYRFNGLLYLPADAAARRAPSGTSAIRCSGGLGIEWTH